MRNCFKNLNKLATSALVACVAFIPQLAMANAPHLTFTDLISGPDTGIGDGKGSGVIVTLWGQHIGTQSDTAKVYFTDAKGTKREAAHVYYWKNADGELPSGPANLYESHKMGEIAFSIPDSEVGPGTIHVEVNGKSSNTLPFTVRAGDIYHVTSNGNDSNSGTWAMPMRTIKEALNEAGSGSTIYVHDVTTGSNTSHRGIYWSNTKATSTLGAQFAVTAYPNTSPKIYAQKGVSAYKTEALVVSKFDIYSSNYAAVNSLDQPTGSVLHAGATFGIYSNKNGRAVANRIGDIPGGCASKYQGAIVGAATFADYVSNFKILGNEVYDYGCHGSSKLHHTTYMTVRSAPDNLQVVPWEFGYNYLHGNRAKFGIHQFDQDDGCGDLTGTLRIHNNVVIDQGGAGIHVGSQCGWTNDVEIENNILINVGLAADWDGKDPSTSNGNQNGGIAVGDSDFFGTVYIRNNLIYNWNSEKATNGGRGCLDFYGRDGDNVSVVWDNNICITEQDQPFMGAGFKADMKFDNVKGQGNFWFDTSGNTDNDNIPSGVTGSLLSDPLVAVTDSIVSLDDSSLTIDSAKAASPEKDIYGRVRGSKPDIGPVEYLKLLSPPNPPSGIIAQ